MKSKTPDQGELTLPYFEPTCRGVFDRYLHAFGFTESRLHESVTMIYFRDDQFLKIGYWMEDAPDYSLIVSMGFARTRKGAPGLAFEGIGLWYAMPAESEVRDYGFWKFSNARELERSLVRVRNEIITTYAKPLWEQPATLQLLVERLKTEIDARHQSEARDQKRRAAELALEAGNYAEAVKIYKELGPDTLTPAERRRLELADKLVSRMRPAP